MSSRSSSVAHKDLVQRHVPITPSASPPVFRTPALPYVRRDNYSPTKRPRLSSTPSSLFSASAASTSSAAVQIDLNEERRASSMRLLSIWDQLAAKYNQPLDRDDIIDLRDGSLVQDRGVLRRAEKLELGYLIADDASSEGGGAETEGDDDVDELDLLAPDADISDEIISEKEKLNIKPVHTMDPMDAEDLHAFLEEERRRRELYGDEEEEEVVNSALVRGGRGSTADPSSDFTDGMDILAMFDDDKDEAEGAPLQAFDPEESGGHTALGRSKSTVLLLDDDSDDEFNTYQVDESTPARPPPSSDPPDDYPEIIDLTDSPTRPAPLNRGRSRARTRPPSQSPPPRAKSRAVSKTPARKNVKLASSPPTRAASPPTQLFTPPRSSSAAGFPVVKGHPLPPTPTSPASPPSPSIPRPPQRTARTPAPAPTARTAPVAGADNLLSASKKRPDVPVPDWDAPLPRPSPRYTPVRKLLKEAPLPRPALLRNLSDTPSVPASRPATKISKRRLIPEVLIARPSRAGLMKEASEQSAVLPERKTKSEEDRGSEKIVRDGKGKQKAVDDVESSPERPLSKDLATLHGSNPRDFRTSNREGSTEISLPTAPRVRKRKRVLSTSSLSEYSPAEEPAGSGPSSPMTRHTSSRPRSPSVSDHLGEDYRGPPVLSRIDRDARPEERARSRSRGRSRSDRPASPAPMPPVYLHSYPHTPSRTSRHQEYAPPVPMQGPGAHMQFAQAVQHLSYLAASVFGIPFPGQGFSASYPLPYPTHAPPWPPYTPTHTRHRSRPPEQPSGDTNASGSSAFRTPMRRQHSFPAGFDPAFSGATLPPSSPPESPEFEQPSPGPIERNLKASTRGRSKSRGRRVSFKLDDDARPARTPSPQRPDAEEVERSGRSRDVKAGVSSSARRAQGRRSCSAGPSTAVAKGKARATEGTDAESASSRKGLQSHRVERGRTPGPPSPSPRSQSVRAKSRAKAD